MINIVNVVVALVMLGNQFPAMVARVVRNPFNLAKKSQRGLNVVSETLPH